MMALTMTCQQSTLAMWSPHFCKVNVEKGEKGSAGSGIILRGTRELILTARHVVDRPGQITVEHQGRIYPARRIRYHTDGDLALLEAPGLPIGFGVSIADTISGTKAGRVWSFGYGPYPGRFHHHHGRYIGEGMRGLYSTSVRPDSEYLMNCESGDSGAGIIDEQGRLVGVVWGGDPGMTSAVSLVRIKDFLTGRNDTAIRKLSSPPQSKPAVTDIAEAVKANTEAIKRLESRIERLVRMHEASTQLGGPANP
jgi:hypothetical protein